MQITSDIFLAFLRCETKAQLLIKGSNGIKTPFLEWQERSFETYRRQCSRFLSDSCSYEECFIGSLFPQELEKGAYRFVFDFLLEIQNLQASIQALERAWDSNKLCYRYIPIRFVPHEKITKYDKLLLAFDSFVLTKAMGGEPEQGIIIHGENRKRMRVKVAPLIKTVKLTIDRIEKIDQPFPTDPVLIKHCSECIFQRQCRQQASNNDDLSLLSSMTPVVTPKNWTEKWQWLSS